MPNQPMSNTAVKLYRPGSYPRWVLKTYQTRYLKNQRFKKLQIYRDQKNKANKAEDTAMNTLIIQITTARVAS